MIASKAQIFIKELDIEVNTDLLVIKPKNMHAPNAKYSVFRFVVCTKKIFDKS